MRGILEWLNRFSKAKNLLARHHSDGKADRRVLVLEALENRLTPSAYTDNQVTNLYRILLERLPEAPALSAWSRALESRRISVGQMAERLVHSPEYTGRLATESYQWYLDREPDPAGLAAHAGALRRGVSQERVDAAILGSEEYFARQGSENTQFVRGLYRDVLEREADTPGLEAHQAALAGGATRTEVAYGFLTSVERGRQVAENAYQRLLGRQGTDAELGDWAGVLVRSAGEPAGGLATVLARVAGSPEGGRNLARPMALAGQPGAQEPWVVKNLKVTPVDTGKVNLSWSPLAGATSYTIKATGKPDSKLERGNAIDFSNLSPTDKVTFTVVPNKPGGGGPEARVEFGAPRVGLIPSYKEGPMVVADGDIWVAINDNKKGYLQRIENQGGIWQTQGAKIDVDGMITSMATGPDGSIWVACDIKSGFVRRIARGNDGAWSLVESIPVYIQPVALTTGKDGTIWVASAWENTLQRIVNEGGKWKVRPEYINVNKSPSALATGLDGSIWVASKDSGTVQRIVNENGTWRVKGPAIPVGKSPWVLSTAPDGAIWVASGEASTVQRIVKDKDKDTWAVEGGAISVDARPYMTAALDGSVWVGSSALHTYQHIVNEGGNWKVKGDAIRGIRGARAMATGPDGSIWVNTNGDTLQQLWTNPNAPDASISHYDREKGRVTLTVKAPEFNGGTPVSYYKATVWKGDNTSQTITTTGNSFVFSGIDPKKDQVRFTVTATNFAGSSPVKELRLGSGL